MSSQDGALLRLAVSFACVPTPDVPRAVAVSGSFAARVRRALLQQSALLSLHNVPWFYHGAVSEHDLVCFGFN